MTAGVAQLPETNHSMIVESSILGPLTVDEEEIIRFPSGLFGLPDSRSFVLLPAEREGLYWLQSVEHAALAFVLVDPFLAFDEYSVELSPADLAELDGADDPGSIAILAIVTLPRSRDEQPTANLQGPVALNLPGRVGKQVAVQEGDFGIRCPFDLLALQGS